MTKPGSVMRKESVEEREKKQLVNKMSKKPWGKEV